MKLSAKAYAAVATSANEYDAGFQRLNLPVSRCMPVHSISARRKRSSHMKILALLLSAPQERVAASRPIAERADSSATVRAPKLMNVLRSFLPPQPAMRWHPRQVWPSADTCVPPAQRKRGVV